MKKHNGHKRTVRTAGRSWRLRPRWRITGAGSIALGPGKADLLETIDSTGSISAAAEALGMSYRRAWVLVATMNASFRRPLVLTTTERRRGASLAPDGVRALRLYRRIESRSLSACRADLTALRRLLRRL